MTVISVNIAQVFHININTLKVYSNFVTPCISVDVLLGSQAAI